MLYSIILVLYQSFSDDDFCSLCLTSALICLILIFLLIHSGFIKQYSPLNKKFRLLYPLTLLICGGMIIFDYNNIKSENDSYYSNNNEPDTYHISISNSVVLGNRKAPIRLIKWTDFQ